MEQAGFRHLVFLSHADVDKPRLVPYIAHLLSHFPPDVGFWIDQPDKIEERLSTNGRLVGIPVAADFRREIDLAIDRSTCVLAFWSKNLIESAEGSIVQGELDRPRLSKKLIQLCLDPIHDLKIPYPYSRDLMIEVNDTTFAQVSRFSAAIRALAAVLTKADPTSPVVVKDMPVVAALRQQSGISESGGKLFTLTTDIDKRSIAQSLERPLDPTEKHTLIRVSKKAIAAIADGEFGPDAAPNSQRPEPKAVLCEPIARCWSEVSVLGRRQRMFAASSGMDMASSSDPDAPLDQPPEGTSLVVDPEGRAALWLGDGVLELTWVNRMAEGRNNYPTRKLPRQNNLKGASLLAVSMSGPAGVRAVLSGRNSTLMLEIEPDKPTAISSIKLSAKASRGAVIRGAMDAILIDAHTGKPSSGLMLGIDSIECIDEADTVYGRLRAAVGISKGERVIVMKTQDRGVAKRIPIEFGPPQGLTIVRNSNADRVLVLYAVDGSIARFFYFEERLS